MHSQNPRSQTAIALYMRLSSTARANVVVFYYVVSGGTAFGMCMAAISGRGSAFPAIPDPAIAPLPWPATLLLSLTLLQLFRWIRSSLSMAGSRLFTFQPS